MGLKTPRNILLFEAKYKNKYPPIGLMKIATYHRMLGDKVVFYKGDVNDFVLEHFLEEAISEMRKAGFQADYRIYLSQLTSYLKTQKLAVIDDFLSTFDEETSKIILILNKFSTIYRKKQYESFPKWDRVYVTTLFTFYWKITVKAIHGVKHLVNNIDDVFVGGVLASLLKNELKKETGITPMEGLLDKPGILDPDKLEARDIIVDDLPLDYSILDEIEYKYPTGSAYFTFMTKGCTRKCKFCSVPILEPTYKPKIPTVDKFIKIKERFGEQQHLLLMDNNVLASPNFPEIIEEIKEMGFYVGATYIEPNQLDIAVKNLMTGYNDRAYVTRSYSIISSFYRKLKGKVKNNFDLLLSESGFTLFQLSEKENLLSFYPVIKDFYEKHRSKIPKARYVDFNQGTDARYVTDDLMRLMSQIPIRPLRIAFDYWGIKDQYLNAVKLAHKYNIRELSNYILYNFNDTPDELYKRLEINVSMNRELEMKIYSFPMKYIPLFGEEAKSRDHIGKHWNKKYIRAIQSILNVTKGIVAPGTDFFELAFGKTIDQFRLILEMPEEYIIYRNYFENIGLTTEWKNAYNQLNSIERQELFRYTHANNFKDIQTDNISPSIKTVLQHYLIRKSSSNHADYNRLKEQFRSLIKNDRFLELTITYDFENEAITKSKGSRIAS